MTGRDVLLLVGEAWRSRMRCCEKRTFCERQRREELEERSKFQHNRQSTHLNQIVIRVVEYLQSKLRSLLTKPLT
jgi:hypothetical protein